MELLKDTYQRQGYVRLKNVLSETEINDLRKSVNKHFNSQKSKRMEMIDYFNDNPSIYNLQFKSKIIKACNNIFGENFYINNSIQVQYNMFGINDKYLGWHIDCGHEYSQKNNSHLYNRDYKFAKIGIYLQDNSTDYGGGIDLISKSQNIFSFKSKILTKIYLTINLFLLKFSKPHANTIFSKAGDVLIFDSRILHRSTINNKTRDDSLLHAGRNKFNTDENSKIAIYWTVGNQFSNGKYIEDMKIRAAREIKNNPEEIVYCRYLSYYYPDSYNKEYIDKIEKNKLKVSTLSKDESKLYYKSLNN
tara:strand:- start:2950 stop:3864 length:915 start_codon:yes stop_codon:yes gene_type:complete